MRYDFFHRKENNRMTAEELRSQPGIPFCFDLPAGLGPFEALKAAYQLGLPRGSARCGCFEIQNDDGIWSSSTGGRLSSKNITFTPWED